MSSTPNVLEYLESKDLELYPASGGNVRTSCFFHGEEGEARTGRLYILVDPESDQTPGLFFCHVCEERGGLGKIQRFFGDEPEATPNAQKLRVLNAAADYYHERLLEDDEAWAYLADKRGFTPDTISRFKFGMADGNLVNHLLSLEFKLADIKATGLVWENGKDFFKPGIITIPYFFYGTCHQIRGRDIEATKNKYLTPPGQPKLLFNADALHEAEEVVVTEGEFDAVMLEEMGYHACGVPGARGFPEEWARLFSDAKRVYICFDPDDVGKEGAGVVAATLGAKARVVDMPRDGLAQAPDINDYFLAGNSTEDFDLLLRKSVGGYLKTVEDCRDLWLMYEGNPSQQGFRIGYPDVDNFMRPNLIPGDVAIFGARTGTGKTILMSNIIYRLIAQYPDINILFASLEQTGNQWFERGRRIHGFYNPEIVEGPDLLNATTNFYKNNLMVMDKNRISPDDMRMVIRQTEDERQRKVDIVIVDYLGYWARAFKGEAYQRTADAIMTMKEIAKDVEAVFLSPAQVNRGSEVGSKIKVNEFRDSGVIEETADHAIAIFNADHGKELRERTGNLRLDVMKSRTGADGVTQEIQYALSSLAMIPKNDDPIFKAHNYMQMANDEVNWVGNNFSFEEVHKRHREGRRNFM